MQVHSGLAQVPQHLPGRRGGRNHRLCGRHGLSDNDAEILAQWWSPAPWTLETKVMDFRVGGYWFYAMVSPENLKHWSKTNYTSIDLHKRIDAFDFFCDENGKPNEKMPGGTGSFVFTKTTSGTLVEMIQVFETIEALNQTLEMGFGEGITICYEQLDKLLAK